MDQVSAAEMTSLVDGRWLPIRDADPRGRWLYRQHYSCYHYRDGRKPAKFIGPGEYMALMTLDCLSLWAWRKFRDDSGQQGVNNAIFRHTGPALASDLIREACELGWHRWPGVRFYTYVDASKIRSTNPGYCYLMAGWRKWGKTDGGLLVLEMLPEWAPSKPSNGQRGQKGAGDRDGRLGRAGPLPAVRLVGGGVGSSGEIPGWRESPGRWRR